MPCSRSRHLRPPRVGAHVLLLAVVLVQTGVCPEPATALPFSKGVPGSVPGWSGHASPEPQRPDPGGVAGRVAALLGEAPFDRVSWGVLAVDLATGETLASVHPDLRFVPASNVKIPVAAAALAHLGPDFRWETLFLSEEPPVEGLLEGNLYLVASGDPTLGSPHPGLPSGGVDRLGDVLRDAGVEAIRGGLVLDVSAWDSTTLHPTWMVEDLEPGYGAYGGAFSLRGGELEIEVRGGADVGAPVHVSWEPRGLLPFVRTTATTSPAGSGPEVTATYLPESRQWLVEGSVPAGGTVRLRVAQRDPVRLAADIFEQHLRTRGPSPVAPTRIVWSPGEPVGPGCPAAALAQCPVLTRIGSHRSPPLAQVLPLSLARSHNGTAEQILRTLGAEVRGEGSTQAGLEVVGAFLITQVGLDSLDFHLRDGSGLSAFNLLSPRVLVEVLAHTRTLPWGHAFRTAMATPGGDGTLQNRLTGLEGRVYAKTGTISHVNGLSGYLVRDDGREIAFSILANAANLPAATVRDRIDRVVRELARP